MTIPKNYVYTVEGIFNTDGDLIRNSIPSMGRDISCDFDLESLGHQAALSFFLNNPEYRTEDKYPLIFNFIGNGETREAEMYLQFAPTFQTKEGKLRKELSDNAKKALLERSKTRRKKKVNDEDTNTK